MAELQLYQRRRSLGAMGNHAEGHHHVRGVKAMEDRVEGHRYAEGLCH
jgi:hypothetical protein